MTAAADTLDRLWRRSEALRLWSCVWHGAVRSSRIGTQRDDVTSRTFSRAGRPHIFQGARASLTPFTIFCLDFPALSNHGILASSCSPPCPRRSTGRPAHAGLVMEPQQAAVYNHHHSSPVPSKDATVNIGISARHDQSTRTKLVLHAAKTTGPRLLRTTHRTSLWDVSRNFQTRDSRRAAGGTRARTRPMVL